MYQLGHFENQASFPGRRDIDPGVVHASFRKSNLALMLGRPSRRYRGVDCPQFNPSTHQSPAATNFERRTQRMKERLLAAAAMLLVAGATAHAQERTLTISVYAFAQDAYDKIVYQPFEKECGCKLVVETGNSAERLAKMEVNKADPVIDMAVMSMADAMSAARQGLVDSVDTSKLSNYARLYDFAKDPNHDGMSVGYTFYATSIAYRSDKVKITSWDDLLSKQLAGRVALPNVTTNQGPPVLYMLGLAMGKDTPDLKAPIDAVGDHIALWATRVLQASSVLRTAKPLARDCSMNSGGEYSMAPLGAPTKRRPQQNQGILLRESCQPGFANR
jgi:spermidine/putrescine-binding protein